MSRLHGGRRALFPVLALLAAPSAFAFEYSDVCNGQPLRWSPGSPNTTWQWASSYPSNDIGASTAKSVLANAFDEWSTPGCSEFDAGQGSDRSGTDPGGNSTLHLIGFYENGWPSEWGSSTLALTLVSYSPSSCLIGDADMVFNGDDWPFATSASGAVDMQAVATHEAGHWLGMDHSSHPGSSLWPSWSGGTDERTLSCDDTEGVCGAYPTGSNSCSADRYCSCGVACTNGTCAGSTPVDPGPGVCGGTPTTVAESEPNDWEGTTDYDYFVPNSNGDFTVTGQVTCGNADYSGDADFFVIDFDCQDQARFTLDWSSDSDLDFYVWDTSSNDPFAGNSEEGTTAPATDDATTGGRIFVEVLCWDGATANYSFTVDWAPFGTTTTTDNCDGLDWAGECVGDTARWCSNNTIQTYDCSDEGGCGWTGDENGYYCLGADGDPDTDPGNDTNDDSGLPWINDCAGCSTNGGSGALALPLLFLLPLLRRRGSLHD